ncbi:hypothetical protein DFH07DRAFT_738703 [Mycena maculata]|uniref:ATP-dependent DNA helicase n=1 Tax=Mycena maculata TaxID=230809 RepID=A0AAD7NJY4_9AGAR|nr:hypothetical protein DFH07DRAFT_738703 [Mycena maculata]
MSKSKSQSGLGSIQRDWSVNSATAPKSSPEIEWSPTPPKPQQPVSSSSSTVELTGREKRLRDIQNALNNRSTPVVSQPFAKPKRSSDTEYPDASDSVPPTKKPRQLPPGWGDDDTMTRATTFNSGSRTARTKSTYTAPPPNVKVSAVFLSGEQTQILKLVQDGKSVFYTGSAGTGKSVLLREIIKTLKKKHIKSEDAVAITASTGEFIPPLCFAFI